MIGEITQLHPAVAAERAWRYFERSTVLATPVKPPRRIELLAFTLGAALFLVAQILVAGPTALVNRSCWIDEYLTQLIVSDPNPAHAVEAIRHGVDMNPPVYQFIGRGIVRVTHLIAPASVRLCLRIFSAACVIVALSGAYLLLRCAFAAGPSIVALLAVWPHPVLIEQMFEARFYAPMLAASVVLAVALQLHGEGRARPLLRAIAVFLSAALLCSIHYFGIVILAVLVIGTLAIDSGSLKGRLMRVAPALLGALALLPFIRYIPTQAAGLTRATFLTPFSPRAAKDFLTEIFYPLPMLILLAGWSAAQLFRQTIVVPSSPRHSRLTAAVPLLSFAVVPMILVVFSAVVQSALRPRYAIVATLAIAPVAAMLASSLRPRVLLAIAGALILMGFMQIDGTARMHNQVQKITQSECDLARHDAATVPIVFADRGDAIEFADVAPDLFSRIVVVDERAPDTAIGDRRRFDLEMMQKARPFYPTPPLITPAQLAEYPRVRIIADSDDLSRLLLEVPMHRVGEGEFAPIRG